MRVRITRDITADGVPFEAGAVVDAAEVEPGCLASMLARRYAVEVPDDEPAGGPGPEPTTPPARKPRRK